MPFNIRDMDCPIGVFDLHPWCGKLCFGCSLDHGRLKRLFVEDSWIKFWFLAYSGVQPLYGDGRMKVVISEESADVLTRVEGMKRWSVAPTMTRGAKKLGAAASKASVQDMKIKPSSPAKKQKSKDKTKDSKQKDKKQKDKTKVAKKIKKTKAPKVLLLETDEPTPASFRRNNDGRAAVLSMMETLNDLDQKMFSRAPAFGQDGHCRLNFPDAKEFTWDEIKQHAVRTMEFMRLTCTLRNWWNIEYSFKVHGHQ